MIDELTSPKEPPAIVLEYLDSDLRAESRCKLLSRPEIKQVAKSVLKVLKTLHQDKIVHAGKSLSQNYQLRGPVMLTSNRYQIRQHICQPGEEG